MRRLAALALLAAGCNGDGLVVVEVTATRALTVDALHVMAVAAGHEKTFDVGPPGGQPFDLGAGVMSFGIDVAPAYFGPLTVHVSATAGGGTTFEGDTPPAVIGAGETRLGVMLGPDATDGGSPVDLSVPPPDLFGADMVPFPRCNQSHLLCEDFEGQNGALNLNIWKYINAGETLTTIDQTQAHSGDYALHLMPVGYPDAGAAFAGGIYEEGTAATRDPNFHLRAFVRTSGTFFSSSIRALNTASNSGAATGQFGNGRLFYGAFAGGSTNGVSTATTFDTNRWVCLELVVDGPGFDASVPADGGLPGAITVWLDNAMIVDHVTVSLLPTTRTQWGFLTGDGLPGQEVWIDDIIVDNGKAKIGCEN